MKRIFLFLAAGTLLLSCDNLKKPAKDTDEETTLKKKKPLSEDENSTEEDEDNPKPKRRTVTDETQEDEPSDRNLTDDEESSEGGWSAADKRTFMSNCVSGATATFGARGAKNYCSCMLDKIEEQYPRPVDAARLTQSDMEPLAKDCINQ